MIKPLGHPMVELQAIHGFAAETTAASVSHLAGHWGHPLLDKYPFGRRP
jgi:PiT family inorganic phosphate transporter